MSPAIPWQLVVFNLSVRKKEKWRWVKPQLTQVLHPTTRCLDVGSGVGTLSVLQEQLGGVWEFTETDAAAAAETKQIVQGPVKVIDVFDPTLLPRTYEVITVFDVIEHVSDPAAFMARIAQLLRPGGAAIVTTPADDGHYYWWRRLAENVFGIDKRSHGHVVEGFSREQLQELAQGADLTMKRCDPFSFFFTEMVELVYNGAYILKNRRRQTTGGYNLALSPASGGDVMRHTKQLQLLRLVYPILRGISLLDHVLP
ncbi:MAG: class I SAM-dependent methyltransferase, partial [Candidatus Andersenbacteria bacterium]